MSLSKKYRNQIRRLCRSHPKCGARHDVLDQKAQMLTRINECARDGVVGIDWSATDCDGTHAQGHSHVKATVLHVGRWLDGYYDDAEGPQSAVITEPEDNTYRNTRDLAMEAYEDGHPHVLYI